MFYCYAREGIERGIGIVFDTPALILEAGSGIVAVAVAEALLGSGIPIAVVTLGRKSLLGAVPGLVGRAEVPWPPKSLAEGLSDLILVLKRLGAGRPIPWPVFATEDGGLRLLLEAKRELSGFLTIPHARKLSLGGLDKAELAEFLANSAAGMHMVETRVLLSIADARKALDEFGLDTVFKPALKPLSMDLRGVGSKVVVVGPKESSKEFLGRLATAWPISTRWVAQPRMIAGPEGEAVWWGARFQSGKVLGVTAYERWKQPRMGGSACWVELAPNPNLGAAVGVLLAALDFVGPLEIPFLRDSSGTWRGIELNSRPWLQVGLAERGGCPVVRSTYRDILGLPLADNWEPTGISSWVNVERMLLAALSGEQGPRVRAMRRALRVMGQSGCRAVWDSPLPGVRRAWVGRMATVAWKQFVPQGQGRRNG